jgi:hypothetical protein
MTFTDICEDGFKKHLVMKNKNMRLLNTTVENPSLSDRVLLIEVV